MGVAVANSYRRDIDGLRAVAILPVVSYHSGLGIFSGGYVGVDVFFVISGFLIAGIIAREVDESRFSILAFYERRARRIIPALTVMMAFVLIMASMFFLPADFAKVPRSALLTTLFLSNVGFFLESGYFAGGSETLPLLHTWSLAVEEQFYLGFPILLLLIARFVPTHRTVILIAIALFSFAIAFKTQASGTGFAFYLLPARAWELFVGAILATATIPQISARLLREGIAILGIAAIGYAALFYSKDTVFPGMTALLPVLGSAALIHSAPRTMIGRILETPFMVGIGLISYSLYLWHWPIIVFAEYRMDAKLTGLSSLVAICSSLLAAYLSWRFIERPFRDAAKYTGRKILGGTAAAMTVASLASIALMMTSGWPSRFPANVLLLEQAKADFSPVRAECITNEIDGERPGCTLGAPVPPATLVWGDSHGVELAWALSEKKKKIGQSLMQRTRGSCPPILGYSRLADPGCVSFNQAVIAKIKAQPELKTIILTAFWAGGNYSSAATVGQLDQTIKALLALRRHVVLIGAVPPQPFDVPRHLAHLAQLGEPLDSVGAPKSAFLKDSAWISRSFEAWRRAGVSVIEPAMTLCDEQLCAAQRGKVPLYFDSHHLSLFGARTIVTANPSL